MPLLALWMPYAMLVGACIGVMAIAAEWVLRAAGRPTRHVWSAALWLSPLLATALALAPSTPAFVRASANVTAAGARARAGAPDARVAPGAVMLDAASRTAGAATRAAPRSAVATLERWQVPLLIAWGACSAAVAALVLGTAGVITVRIRRAGRGTVSGTDVRFDEQLGPAANVVGGRCVLLPAWTRDLSAPLQALVVRHELEHLQAGDPWTMLLSAVPLIAMPWSPALWVMRRRLRLAIELDCDARTLAGSDVSREQYASLLLLAAQHAPPARAAAWLVPSMAAHLRQRIMMIATPASRLTRPMILAAVIAVVAAVAALISVPRPIRAQGRLAHPEYVGVYLMVPPSSGFVQRDSMFDLYRAQMYLRLAADGRSRNEAVQLASVASELRPVVTVTPWSPGPWVIETHPDSGLMLCLTSDGQSAQPMLKPGEKPRPLGRADLRSCIPHLRDSVTGDLTWRPRSRAPITLRRLTEHQMKQ